jgi:hypothetical protein
VQYIFHQAMTLIGEARVDLDEIGARGECCQGVLRSNDAADADDGNVGAQFRAQLGDDVQDSE